MNTPYFHETVALNADGAATSVPVYQERNGKSKLIGHRNLDITLYFDPYVNPEREDNKAFANQIGSFKIATGADEITWGYGLNTKRTPTYGGEVVQILSMYADKMRIKGTCRNYKELRAIYDYFKKYMSYVSGSSGAGLDRRQNFLQFRYPARDWSFIIMVTEAPNMRMATAQAAPEWEITAEIVSENDRLEIGSRRVDEWANVLSVAIPQISRITPAAKSRSARLLDTGAPSSRSLKKTGSAITGAYKSFKVGKGSDPFGDLMAFANGGRGAVADNFEAMMASYTTGTISTLRTNPLAQPDKSAKDIYTEKYGTEIAFTSDGGGGTGTLPTGEVVYGTKQRVFATAFGGPNDPTAGSLGHAGGQEFDLNANPDSYAELSTNRYNSANGAPADGVSNNYNALGNLPALTPIRVTYNGKSKVLYKRDVGFGGNGPDGQRGTEDDPKIDIWWKSAEELGFNGYDYVEIEIGSGSVGTPNPPNLGSSKRANAVAWAKWLYDNRTNIIYQTPPDSYSSEKRTTSPSLPMRLDCSSSTSYCLMWAGGNQIGVKWTGAMLSKEGGITEVSRYEDIAPGDLWVNNHHVVMAVSKNSDGSWHCFSHGGGTAEDAADPSYSPNYRDVYWVSSTQSKVHDSLEAGGWRRWPGID